MSMSVESLLAYVPPLVIYRRVPLEADHNALEPWRQAVREFVKPDDENDLWGELIYGSHEGGDGPVFPAVDREWANRVLETNAAALALFAISRMLEDISSVPAATV